MSKLLKEKVKKMMILTLVLMSTSTMLLACTKEIEDIDAVDTNVETRVDADADAYEEPDTSEEFLIASDGEKLSEEDRLLVDKMLKRMEVAINQNDTASFSEEFKLLMSDYTESQINDINTKLLAFVEEKHNFYFYEVLNENLDSEGNRFIIVRMGYKNLDEADETNEYVQMLVEENEDGNMNVYKIYFLNEDQYAQYK